MLIHSTPFSPVKMSLNFLWTLWNVKYLFLPEMSSFLCFWIAVMLACFGWPCPLQGIYSTILNTALFIWHYYIFYSTLICVSCLFSLPLIQRAKIGPSKNSEGKSANSASRFDSNGNQDRMKLADFNFLMVLGKGSFGKVRPWCLCPHVLNAPKKCTNQCTHV